MTTMTSPVLAAVQPFRWQVEPGFEHILGENGLRLSEWLREGQASILKQATHRTIYRVDLPGQALYVKHYPIIDVRGWLRQFLRPSKARSEFARANALARRGIATFVPLAYGESTAPLRWGECFLVSQAIEDAQQLDVFLQSLPSAASRKVLATALAAFIARMHQAGVRHQDFHPGNILVRMRDDELEFFLIDLHAVRFSGPLSWRMRRDNLAMLNNWFAARASRSDRLRFFRAYCERAAGFISAGAASARRDKPGGSQWIAAAAREIEEKSWQSMLAIWARRDRRCLQDNRYFRRLSPGGAKYAVREMNIDRFTEDPDAPFRRPDVRILKNSRSSCVVEIGDTIYKRFNHVSWLDSLLSLFRPTKALRSWWYGHALIDRFLPTPRPLLVLHRRRLGLCREGYLLTEKIANAQDLHEFLASERNVLVLRACIEQTARIVRTLHRHDFSHRDLKACNILVSRNGDAIKVWLIDLVGVEKHGKLPWRRKIQNLARLHASFHNHPQVSNADKLRFLRLYLQCGLFGSRNWKTWWRAIAKATLAKIARNRRIGRPLA